jgi:transcription elongation factor GreB
MPDTPSPDPPRSNYITPEGAQRLRDEVKYLWEVDRPRVTEAVSEAAALGDRSENAEYIYGKKRLREIDRRLHYLTKRLDALTIVQPNPALAGKVYFGAWVKLKSEEGKEVTYRVVGPDEIDLDAGMISIDSPIGRSLMRKNVGDHVVVKRPIGDVTYTILAVQYEPFEQ